MADSRTRTVPQGADERPSARLAAHGLLLMRIVNPVPNADDLPGHRRFPAVSVGYLEGLALRIRSLALDGRGDDARGRHLASLYALEWAYRNGLFAYRPSRDPGHWLLLLLDVAGARAGLAPTDRVQMSADALFARLCEIDLRHIVRHTRAVVLEHVARRLGLSVQFAEPLLARMSVAAVLNLLGVGPADAARAEKHPQGRQVRKVLRARVDAGWERRLGAFEPVVERDPGVLLAALPISFGLSLRTVQSAMLRVGEDLAHVPFAVYYALLTDARRGGRVWRPPDRYVEGGCYDRATFDLAVGHALDAVRSRKRRYRRSSALSELGMSALFPATVARLDAWLERYPFAPFRLDAGQSAAGQVDWYLWAQTEMESIEALHARLVAAFAAAAGRNGEHAAADLAGG